VISIDPWGYQHELGQLHTDERHVATHLCLALVNLSDEFPPGRAPTATEERRRQEILQRAESALRPVARNLIRRLDRDLNDWLRDWLVLQPASERLTDEQVWHVLEHSSPRAAFTLFAVPAIREQIERFRLAGARSKETRERLRRAFRRLAVAAGPAGAPKSPKRTALSQRDEAALVKECRRLYEAVKAFRDEWKGSLHMPEAWTEAYRLVADYCPGLNEGSRRKVMRGLIAKTTRPRRAAEFMIQQAYEGNYSAPVIRRALTAAREENGPD